MKVIIPALDYWDFLATTLPAWRNALPSADIVVAIGPVDIIPDVWLQQLDVRFVWTDVWHRAGACFNKAGALTDALRAANPSTGEVVLAIDADIYPGGPFPDDSQVSRGTIYGAPRYECATAAVLRAVLSGQTRAAELPLILPRVNGEPSTQLRTGASLADARACGRRALGYLQAFRFTGQTFGASQTGGGYDNRFARQFRHRDTLPDDFFVLHLGEQSRENWRGRVVARWGAA